MSYLRRILSQVDPSLSANIIAERLVRMCRENPDLCRKYVYGE
jgi:hypothetical protein